MTTHRWGWYDEKGQRTKSCIVMTESNGYDKWEWYDGKIVRELHMYSKLEKYLQNAFKRCIGGTLPALAACDDASRREPGVLLFRANSLNTFSRYSIHGRHEKGVREATLV